MNYEKVCLEYVNVFCKKQDFYFDGWVGNDVGGIALCSDFFFNFHDIVWDINTNQKKGEIIKWYDYILDRHSQNKTEPSMTYYSWTKGFRFTEKLHELVEDENNEVVGTNPEIETLRKVFMEAIDDYNSKQVIE